ncbi:MAG: MFS transporter [Candidatus Latescibacteria bacterium]|nr:MFS transporter [Candidatus Latescibacterota bacterium]
MKAPSSVVIVGAGTAFSLLGDQALYAILPTYYEELGLLPFQVGILLSANRWVRLFTNHVAVVVCRRGAPHRLLMGALAIGAGCTAAYGLSSSFAVLLGLRLLWGLCWSFIRQIGLMAVVNSSGGRVGQLMGLYSLITRMGSVAGNFAGGLGHDLLGFTGVMMVFAVCSLVAVPLGLGARPNPASPPDRTGGRVGAGLLVCGLVLGGVGQGVVMSTLGLVLKEALGETVQVAGWTIGIATVTGALMGGRWVADALAPLWGWMADRLGRQWGAGLFFGLGAIVLAAAALAPSATVLIGAVLCFYLCATGAWLVVAAEAGVRGPGAVAWYVTAADLGSALGPLVAWLGPQFELPTPIIFWVGAALYSVAACAGMVSFSAEKNEQGKSGKVE